MGIHLFVLHHGLWGDHSHMNFIISRIEEGAKTSGESVEFINCAVNEGTNSYAGIEGCGSRLVELIFERLKDADKPAISHLSFVGYSFGGLVIRYAAGVLFARNILVSESTSPQTSSDAPTVIAANFVTFASPHLGAPRTSPESATLNPIFNSLASFMTSTTGSQMMLTDASYRGRKAVNVLADPSLPFYQSLLLFKNRVIYANLQNDPLVSHRTASILETEPSPLTKPLINYLSPVSESYPSIVELDPSTLPSVDTLPKSEEEVRTLREKVVTTLFSLCSFQLHWWLSQVVDCIGTVFAVHVRSSFRRAHATIVRRADEFKGNEDVVQHFIDLYCFKST
ncbi:DUF676-domain-containing protein [Rhizoclosmatium globosum]|uniref:DUF676-domain-containing protein n=1 Tax=Rhizoclosmatium globosum TaxID=329046 RepID=A0A1Y2CF81_9FUNG|nr:DUF676-domain-containing protein [Rhizoclosmatium globosum]|eukprot:ORY45682.1 DUF676-domain-containing protein [Rhizoclosmatium globosum]